MTARNQRILLAAAAAWFCAGAVRTAEAVPGPVVELPPMIVEEAASLPPWLYVGTEGAEYLSRCTETTTRGYVEMRRSRMEWVHALFPEEFFARMDVPVVTVLVSQKHKPSNNAEVIGEVLSLQSSAGDGYRRTRTAPNVMLNDSDSIGVFAYIDEANFDRRNLTVSSDNVRFLLARRTPALPAWLLEGMAALYNEVLFEQAPITLAPLAWHSPGERQALLKDSGAPRTLLPMAELFAGAGAARSHPEIARFQTALMLRWALDPQNGVREKFWNFAAKACETPVTEGLCHASLGMGFSDLRDRLSDYLPIALRSSLQIPLAKMSAGAAPTIRRATPVEIARLRGEWERLSVALMRKRHPDHAQRYVDQARRTLQRAYDSGEREPRLLAAIGLCEIDAGNAAAARDFLERAVAEGVVRPRAYHELARLRWTELVRAQPASRQFSATELSPVLDPLRRGLRQAPILKEELELWAEAWTRSEVAPGGEDLQQLKNGARLFLAEPRACLRVVRALGRHGKTTEAMELLGEGFVHLRDDATRAQYAQMFAALKPRP